MPLEIVSAEDALAITRANKDRVHPTQARGADRMIPYAQVRAKLGLRFALEDPIFAAGSCFARNIEKSLGFIGGNVISSARDIYAPPGADNVFQLYNKYTIHSILNEIRWAAGQGPGDTVDTLTADGAGRVFDLQVTSAAGVTGTLDEMTRFRRAYNAAFATAFQAKVVIVTLGMAECWFDQQTGVYLNMAPPKPLMDAYPGRYQFHLLGYDDILAALEEMRALILATSGHAPRFLITVSPVSMSSTFRDRDVLEANCYSKSVQRAAVEAFAHREDVYYFPSYEYVTLTDNAQAWIDKDFRHVRQETVDRIMADVLEHCVGPSREQRLLRARGHATALRRADDQEGAIAEIEALITEGLLTPDASSEDEQELMWVYAQALMNQKRRDECIAICLPILRGGAKFARSAGRTALNLLRMQARWDDYRAILAEYEARYPDDEHLPRFHDQLSAAV